VIRPPDWRNAGTRARLILMVVVGAAAAVVSAALGAGRFAPLVGWDLAATLFSTLVWATVLGMDARQTAAHAGRDDPGRAAGDALVLGAGVASLVGVGIALGAANTAHGTRQGLLAGLAVASVALSWTLVHTLFTLRYARLFYAADGGVDFNGTGRPRYVDFAYLAFTVGMTFQVSDTAITSRAMRGAVVRHALVSYLFGAVILATTVNFIVGLSSGASH
jgi:uncharacterized membrane protein